MSVSVIVVLDRTRAVVVVFSRQPEDDMSASDLSLLPKQRHHQLRGNEVTLHPFPLCRKLKTKFIKSFNLYLPAWLLKKMLLL